MPRRGKRSWHGPRLGAPFCRVSPCGARYFPSDGKVPKGSPGDAAGANFVRYDGLPPVPHHGGRVPGNMSKISGAQNLSGWSKFPPGHWALGLQKLKLVRFHSRAWLCRAGGGWCRAVGRGLLGAPRTSAGRPVSGPYKRRDSFCLCPSSLPLGGRLPLSRRDVAERQRG